MAFVLSKVDTYPWPVRVSAPDPDRPGKRKVETFDGIFRRLPRSRLAEIGNTVSKSKDDAIEAEDATYCLIAEVLVGWEGVRDDKGEEIPFSEKMRDELAEIPAVAAAIMEAFTDSISGDKARRGN